MPYGTVNADLMTTSDGVSSAGLYGFKNRIINGDMRIDQRNAGASVTPSASPTYTLDRWAANFTQASKYSVQQSSTSSTGFSKSLLITSLASTSAGTGDFFAFQQIIEGFNIADLGFGTANAQTVTISFDVRSSLTGTFGGCLTNGSHNRSYPFTFTINSANTFERKSITIAGDTSGTWATDNTAGMRLWFGLGAGSTYSGTAGAWAGSAYVTATGATSVVGTSGATFYITGVQLEKGSTATSFDYRPYGTELALCQRYCWVYGYQENAVLGSGFESASTAYGTSITPVPMRSAPSISANSSASTFSINDSGSGGRAGTGISLTFATTNNIMIGVTASGLTSNAGCIIRTNSSSSYIVFSSEL